MDSSSPTLEGSHTWDGCPNSKLLTADAGSLTWELLGIGGSKPISGATDCRGPGTDKWDFPAGGILGKETESLVSASSSQSSSFNGAPYCSPFFGPGPLFWKILQRTYAS